MNQGLGTLAHFGAPGRPPLGARVEQDVYVENRRRLADLHEHLSQILALLEAQTRHTHTVQGKHTLRQKGQPSNSAHSPTAVSKYSVSNTKLRAGPNCETCFNVKC